MHDLNCKLLVIGGGPGGYVCAIRAGQLGIDTILVEKAELGGTCLNIGCIPSKALIHAADEFHKLVQAANGSSALGLSAKDPSIDLRATVAWKDGVVKRLTGGVGGLLRKAKVRVLRGEARIVDGKTVEVVSSDGTQTVRTETMVVATGSRPVELPFLPFGGNVLSSTEALSLDDIPKTMVVVGGGYIGLELGTVFRKLGCEVTVVEAAPKILPQYDEELTRPLSAHLKALGIRVLTETRAIGQTGDGKGLKVAAGNGTEEVLAAEKVLVTVGRKPCLDGWNLESLQLTMTGPYLQIDDRCRTSMTGVYAIGDVTGEPMLAHRAMAQGEMVAELVAGENRSWDKYCIPAICFTDPEIVTAGMSPAEARSAGLDIKVGTFPFKANGRAMTMERDDGFVRIVAHTRDHVILGVQATGAGISELSGYFAFAIESGARLEDVAATVHAHPGLGEAVQEASFSALGHTLHI